MKPILDAVVELHDAFEAAEIPHAFGGAFALLWCTGEPRTTVDIDVNLFVPSSKAAIVLAALPPEIHHAVLDTEILEKDGQHRLFFDEIPIDLFLNTTEFHDDLQLHAVEHELDGRRLPFLSCNDLAVFKAMFNRRRDWADIEEMARANQIDEPYVAGVLIQYLGLDDTRIGRLDQISKEVRGDAAPGQV